MKRVSQECTTLPAWWVGSIRARGSRCDTRAMTDDSGSNIVERLCARVLVAHRIMAFVVSALLGGTGTAAGQSWGEPWDEPRDSTSGDATLADTTLADETLADETLADETLAGTTASDATPTIVLRPVVGVVLGTHDFALTASVEGTEVSSLLEWDAEAVFVGLDVAVPLGSHIIVMAGATLTPANLGVSMQDRDWIELGVPWGNYLFSDTLSDVKSFYLTAHLGMRYALDPVSGWGLAVVGGVRYEHYAAGAYGFRGTQQLPGTLPVSVDVPDVHGVEIAFDYGLAHAGLLFDRFFDRFGLGLEAGLMGGVALTYDDHLLRGKDVHGTTGLLGWRASARGALRLWTNGSFQGQLEVFWNHRFLWTIAGSMEQRFYADDPSSPDEDETGLVFENEHDQDTFVHELGLAMTVGF
jgi:hypothetical protein